MEHEVTTPVQNLVDSANRAAMETVEVYLTARGLFELIDTFRFRDVGSPIPAPGSADLTEEIRTDVLEAMHAVATCRIVAKTGDTHAESQGREAIDTARAQAWSARHRAVGRILRLAEVGLGVAQHAYEDDEVEFLERATIGVLVGPYFSTMGDGPFPLFGSTAEETSVVLAGMIARLLCDPAPGPGFLLSERKHSSTLLNVQIGSAEGLVVTAGDHRAPRPSERVLRPDGKVSRTVPAPVVITEVTASLLETLRSWGVDFTGLHAAWIGWHEGPYLT